jgi:hypothetical protein
MKPLTAILAVALTGCASFPTITQERQAMASAHIGCAPAEISVVNTGSYTWEATCKAKVFYCTVSPSAACAAKI